MNKFDDFYDLEEVPACKHEMEHGEHNWTKPEVVETLEFKEGKGSPKT